MAEHRPAVPLSQKRELLDEAGGKCANPGCTAYLLHIHHIHEWHVYKTHESEHMIALCPNCHDAVHRGSIRIDDASLYEWKQLRRAPPTVHRDVLFVEAAAAPRLLLGSIAVEGESDLVVFDLNEGRNRLGFRVEQGELNLVGLVVTSSRGDEIIRVIDNRIAVPAQPPVTFETRPGRVRVTVPANDHFVPWWLFGQLRQAEADFGMDGVLVLADVTVVRPGLVRVQGIWAQQRRAVVITEGGLHFARQGMDKPITVVGDGEGTVIRYAGPVTSGLFEFP